MEIIQPENRAIIAFLRRLPGEDPILVVANLSKTVQPVSLDLAAFAGWTPVEMDGGIELPRHRHGGTSSPSGRTRSLVASHDGADRRG